MIQRVGEIASLSLLGRKMECLKREVLLRTRSDELKEEYSNWTLPNHPG